MYLIVLVALLMNLLVVAQPTHVQLKQLSTDQGLSSSTIISFLQDHKGFMWVGTIEGLNRYDGAEFKVYKYSSSDPNSLPDNFIISMLLDREKMYVGTNAGVSLYNPATDGFVNFNKDSASCLFNHTFQVRAMAKGSGDNLYVATSIGLIIFNPTKNTFKQIPFGNEIDQSTENIRINSLCVVNDNNLLLGTTRGLWLFSNNTQQIKPLYKGIGSIDYSKVRINKIVSDNTGEIWLTSYSKGFFKLKKSALGEYELKHIVSEKAITNQRLLSLAVDSNNNLWIGAENDGVYVFNQETQLFSHFLSNDSDPLYTTTYSVESLCFDDSDNLWIGTFAHGVHVHAKNSDAIVSYSKFKGGDLGVTNNMVNAFTEDKNGNVWVGTDGGGIHVLNRETGWFKSYNTKNSKIQSDYILSMADDGDKIWLTTWGAGLLCYNQKQGTFIQYNKDNSTIPDHDIFSICKGLNNDLWLGSYSNGLIHFFPEENRFVTYNTTNSGIDDNYVNVVRAAPNGKLLVGTRSGLELFDVEKKEFTSYSLLDLDAKTLSNLHVYDIFYENDTSVWVATLSGLNRINLKDGVNEKFTVRNGLPSNNVRGVLKDKLGNLWIATTKGVCRFDEHNSITDLFTKSNGLQTDEIRPRSLLKDSSGNLFFGGMNGFNIIYPDKLEKNTKVPKVIITQFDIFNEAVVPNAEGSPLTQIISETKELRLKHDQSVLTFYFAVLDFTRPSNNLHAYMLENFDKDWIYSGSRRKVTYTNLDPGTYILRVKGSNNDGVWNEEGVALKIVIIPPWWASWWFKSMFTFSVLALIALAYYLRVSQLKKQKEKLEITVKERTKELAEINATKDKLFSIVAHDLRSPFNVILGFTDLLLENQDDFDKNETRKVLVDLKKSGQNAFALLENLLNWSYSQRNQIVFQPDNISIDELFPKVIEELKVISSKKNIKLVNKQVDHSVTIYADYNLLSLIFRNLITNAVKFSNPETEVWLNASTSGDGWVTICVADHGIGIEQNKANTLFELRDNDSTPGTEGEKGTGLGLIISKEFVEKHKGRIWVESTLGEGSTFCFSVPGSKEVYAEASL